MDMYDALVSSGFVLNEQIARQIFENLDEKSPLVVIVDRNRHYWPSNSEEFSALGMDEAFLQDICSRVDDGGEPVITAKQEYSVVASQLATDRTNCGYVLLLLDRYNPESVLANIGLVEMVLSQIALIAKLIEKNTLLYELQMRHFSRYTSMEKVSN